MPRGVPEERSQTVREALRQELLRGPTTARQLSERVSISEKDVAAHLEHLERSLKARGERLLVSPASCIACGYSFDRRKKLSRPGSCPECKSTRIDPPAFSIEGRDGGAEGEQEDR